MTSHRSLRLSSTGARIKRALSKLGYANRRMFDIRAGEHFMNEARGKSGERASTRPHGPGALTPR